MTATDGWTKFKRAHLRRELLSVCISKVTDYGLLTILEPDIIGIVHMQDIDWNTTGIELLKRYSVGDTVDTLVLSVEPEKGRVCLGIKQIKNHPDRNSGGSSPEEPRPARPSSPKSPESGAEAATENREGRIY